MLIGRKSICIGDENADNSSIKYTSFYYESQNVMVIFAYLKSDVYSTEKEQVDIINMNLFSFAPYWFSISFELQ